jgi:hypothetical protein
MWRQISPLFLLALCVAFGQDWKSASDGRFVVLTASPEDALYLPEIFTVLQRAQRDLRRQGLELPETIGITIHPHLDSFLEATGVPWYVMATADRDRALVHSQRVRVLLERGSLEKTLRHELFHLGQPEDWPRWRAEGAAMIFAGEKRKVEPLEGIGERELEEILASAPSAELLTRAMATAYLWVLQGSRN